MRKVKLLGPRRKFLIRSRQGMDSNVFYFVSRLSRRMYKHGIRLKRVENPGHLLTKLSDQYRVLREKLLKKRYYLMIRRKRSNFYFSVVNHLGGVVFSISMGRYVKKSLKRRNRKLRVGYSNYTPIIRIICSALRRKRIFRIHTVFKPLSVRTYTLRRILNTFSLRGVKIKNIAYTPEIAHGRAHKNKKARRL